MIETQFHRSQPTARSRRRRRRPDVLARLAELLGRDGEADQSRSIAEDEKLTRARLALFGCAPK